MNKYRVKLGISGVEYDVTPIFNNETSLVFSKPDSPSFADLLGSLSQTLEFRRSDFDLIDQQPFQTKFSVIIEESKDNGETFSVLPFTGEFYKVNAEIYDRDNKQIKVKVRADDKYRLLYPGLDREQDLIDLGPEVNSLLYKRQAVLQLHSLNTNILMNYQSGTYWEQVFDRNNYPFDPTDPNSGYSDFPLRNYYHFGPSYSRFIIPGDSSLSPDVSGLYVPGNGSDPIFREDGAYKMEFNGSQWFLRTAAGVPLYAMQPGEPLTRNDIFGFNTFNNTPAGTFVGISDPSQKCQVFFWAIYGRILTDKEELNGQPTFELNDPEISSSGFGFQRAFPIQNLSNYILLTDQNQSTNSRYGQFVESAEQFPGQFFSLPAANAQGFQRLPINRSTWRYCSAWFSYGPLLYSILEEGSEDLTIRHAYRLKDCLRLLAQSLDPEITFEATSSYSQFLYPDNGLNPVSGEEQPVYLFTPKSNFTLGEYDRPAQRAETRLAEFAQFLYSTLRCKWFVDDQKRLRVEHVLFFENGGSYTSPVLSRDLTTEIDPRTNLPWAYRTENWTYREANLPEEIRIKWMDKQSIPFDGFPIVILSPFADPGNYIEENLRFSSDLDFMTVNSPSINLEGFAAFAGWPTGNLKEFEVRFIEIEGPPNFNWNLQNGHLANIYLQPRFHKNGLPASDVKINDEETTASSVEKNRIQEVSYPFPDVIDTIALVKTTIGDGQLQEVEIPLSSRFAKITLNHDTE